MSTEPEPSEEELRIWIAERCGYSFRDEGWRYPNEPRWQQYPAVYRDDGFIGLHSPELPCCPNYTRDLNAMAEAEKTLTDHSVRQDYKIALQKIILPDASKWCSEMGIAIVHATALQRARAFYLAAK